MLRPRALLLLALGVVLGVGLVLANEQVDRYTSTDAFCGGACHSMSAHVVSDPVYQASAHRNAKSGVLAGCADCHIPHGIVPATWTHVRSGIKDMWVETFEDVKSAEAWAARRDGLAAGVRDWLLETDSATCRNCHREDAIQPERRRGQSQHEEAREKGLTCIGCHYNLVHEEAPVSDEFLERAARGKPNP